MKRATRIMAGLLLALAVFAMVAGDLLLASAADLPVQDVTVLQRADHALNDDFNSFARMG
ncbi:hypothetical protein [Paracoccus fistulariae]|uniref:Uncharacterized protein n=1 Tax=Paracoccus fistulariae TaxID=658446 RepID=A0ABY7SKK4_9RHOB|nr:hypothetical protein [Paracoccus fistulariae]MDB6181335.1 hypothetical protein [Paracoccus fistulariae]WCR07384.1 hypothetical protein JHX87_00565 [Paracoccus fistulariae]